jgi:hypothetical protein
VRKLEQETYNEGENMAKIIQMYPKADPIDEDLTPDELDFVNRRSKEIGRGVYEKLEAGKTFGSEENVSYLIKRALVEGIMWEKNKIN